MSSHYTLKQSQRLKYYKQDISVLDGVREKEYNYDIEEGVVRNECYVNRNRSRDLKSNRSSYSSGSCTWK